MRTITHKYGWKPDVPDHRDKVYRAPAFIPLPERADLRPSVVHVYNQGSLGSCTANALAAAFQFERQRQGLPPWNPSRLFIYYNERTVEDTIHQDAGAMLRDGIKTMVRLGVCPEDQWPYVYEQFDVKPGEECYAAALDAQVLGYRRVSSSLLDMKSVLAQGLPFVVGIGIYESFETQEVAKTGTVPMPDPGERLLGGHAVTVVGYDEATKRFTLLNSWGPEWGDEGFFTLPYEYLTHESLADDRWLISKTE
jgi:C1A family cysteine protease